MCSHLIIGVTIGCLNVAGFMIASAFLTTTLTIDNKSKLHYDNDVSISTPETAPPFRRSILVGALVACITMALMSVLLVVGIVRKRYSLMIPWIVFSFIALICNSLRCLISMIPFKKSGEPDLFLFESTGGCMTLCLQTATLYVIYKLYKHICRKTSVSERDLDSFDDMSETE